MPIHRLNERPTRQAVLATYLRFRRQARPFIDLHDVKRVLTLHEPNGGEYYLCVFLVGAYQETIGDMHNLWAIPMFCTFVSTNTARCTT